MAIYVKKRIKSTKPVKQVVERSAGQWVWDQATKEVEAFKQAHNGMSWYEYNYQAPRVTSGEGDIVDSNEVPWSPLNVID